MVESLEPRKPFLTLTWWQPPEMHIWNSAETARAKHDQILSRTFSLIFYTDGSVVNEKVGVIAIQRNSPAIRQTFLGRMPKATVFLAKLQGLQMALEMALETIGQQPGKEVTIFSDSQAAIKALPISTANGNEAILYGPWTDNALRARSSLNTASCPAFAANKSGVRP